MFIQRILIFGPKPVAFVSNVRRVMVMLLENGRGIAQLREPDDVMPIKQIDRKGLDRS